MVFILLTTGNLIEVDRPVDWKKEFPAVIIALCGPTTDEERFSAVSVIPVFPIFLVMILLIVIPGLNGLILLGRKFFDCRFIEFEIEGF